MADSSTANYIELAADIVSAYVSNNSVSAGDLPGLINSVHNALLNVTSGKVKRIRNDGRVRLAPCDARGRLRGDWLEGHARMLDGPEGVERGLAAIERKYGWQMRLALFASRLSGRYAQRGVIEISAPPPIP